MVAALVPERIRNRKRFPIIRLSATGRSETANHPFLRFHPEHKRRACHSTARDDTAEPVRIDRVSSTQDAAALPTRTKPAATKPELPILQQVHEGIVGCTRCPRLRAYGENLGVVKRAAYRDQEYWSKPVPGFGDPKARIRIVGLAPGAHGANRTGRPFTGDAAGKFMYDVLHELGLASQPHAISRDDGLKLRKTWIGSVVRCAPPGDKPTPEEIRNCASHLTAEIAAMPHIRVIVCLGKIAWDGFLAHLLAEGTIERRSAYHFTHGAEYKLPDGTYLLGSYHPSARNVNTRRLNRSMFAKIFVRALELAGLG
jgi:uracil-DNA glycosylase family 4